MKDNPFLSDTFTRIWSKHFNKDKPTYFFKFIANLSFMKFPWLPIYFNIGKNHTKGISYALMPDQNEDYTQKVFFIYDVPTFLNLQINSSNKKLGLTKIKQYPGFLVELIDYSDFNQYFSSSFSKSSRYKLNKYKKRLESCFDISYKMYYGAIDPEQYKSIFVHFKQLLEKRFLDKGTTNNNLDPKEWNFYTEVAYPMILEKKASLFVIYNGDTPIGVTLNYFSDTIVFDAITVFDIDYEKFHLGSVTIMKLIEWSINQKFQYFDFSKGYFDYKKRWATKEYYFEYHLYYDTTSKIASITAYLIANYLRLKNYFRNRNLNESFHRITFILKGKAIKTSTGNPDYIYEELVDNYDIEQLAIVDYNSQFYSHLKNMVFNFLYLKGEMEKDITLYQVLDVPSFYIIESRKKQMKVIIK